MLGVICFFYEFEFFFIFFWWNWNVVVKDNGENMVEGDNDVNIIEMKVNGFIGDEDFINVLVLEGEVVNE